MAEMGLLERGQGEGGNGGGEVPCQDGAGSRCIGVSAGEQRILKRRGPGKGRSKQGAAGKAHPEAIHTSMPSRKSPFIPDIRIEGRERGWERRDGDRWTMDADAGGHGQRLC